LQKKMHKQQQRRKKADKTPEDEEVEHP